jgi:anti-sigma B factor antagonist
MEYCTDRAGPAVTLKISGELDAVTVDEIRCELDQIAAGGGRVVDDLSALRLVDTVGVRAIVSVFRRVSAEGRQFEVTGVQGQPSSIFEVLRLHELFRPR